MDDPRWRPPSCDRAQLPSWLVVVLSLSLLLPPAPTLAQSSTKLPRVGYLNVFSIPSFLEGFKQGLRDHGWRDGENIIIEARDAGGRVQRVQEAMAELVRMKVDVLLLTATTIQEVKPRAGSIPIVFAIDLGVEGICGGRWIHGVRNERPRDVSPRRVLRRSDSQGCKSG